VNSCGMSACNFDWCVRAARVLCATPSLTTRATGMQASPGSTCPRMRMGRPGTPDVLRQTAAADGPQSGALNTPITAPTPARRLTGTVLLRRAAAGRAPSGREVRG
jgi:hypothetical protein